MVIVRPVRMGLEYVWGFRTFHPFVPSQVVFRYTAFNYTQELLQKIATALEEAQVPDKAGALYERMGMTDQAMQA